jgi:mannose-1-phosphate guanylyltransferase
MYVVLMAGGTGTRFWPRSRKKYPKQLLNIIGSRSMLQLTFDRIRKLTSTDRILIITNEEQKPQIEKQLPEIPSKNIISEPMGRNTAPCIGLAATIIKKIQIKDEVMVVLPADHLIGNASSFIKTINSGVEYIKNNDCLLTLGVTPVYPETGYGYIQAGEKISDAHGMDIYKVKTFAEKPNIETAQRFIKSGDFFWNSGMFIWKVDQILIEIDDYLPELSEDLKNIDKTYGKRNYKKTLKDVYSRTKPISIDYGVMENAKNVCVIQADFQWNDLGSWEAVYNISPKDKCGNVVDTKQSILINAQNNYLYSSKKLIAAIDVENLVLVEMDDAILICKRDKSQNVKMIVDNIERKDLEEYL